MKRIVRYLVFAVCLLIPGAHSEAQHFGDPIASYVARLSAHDHFNSNGERLRSPAAIIRQDRANLYVFDSRDPEDESDPYFSSKDNRARLERLLDGGQTTAAARRLIVNGTPLVRVEIYQDFVNVTVTSE